MLFLLIPHYHAKSQSMSKITLLSICLCFSQWISGQSIQEICTSTATNGTVVDCHYFNDSLYATGFFNVICGNSVGYIAKWENNEWQPSAINISDPGHSLRVIDDKLYIAKYEESVDSNWVYVYDNATLEKVGPGVYLTTASGLSALPNIYDIIEYDGQIIACGEFDRVGEASIQGIMQWNGSSWTAMDAGLSGNIQGAPPVMFPHQLMVHNDELYVVGNFRNAGGVEVNGIAKWNGSEWMNLGAGFNNTVYSIVVFNDEIIVGGSFTESNGTALNRIAKWDGTNWVALDFGFTPTSMNDFIFVHTLKNFDDVLYIGGGLKEITYADNTTESCNGIISYANGTINTYMGGVPNNDIEAICKIDNNQLLFGGGVFGSGYTGITEIETSTIESHFDAKVVVSPNPFTTSIDITTDAVIETYEITNELGEVLAFGNFASQIHLDVPAGIYFLKLTQPNKAYTVRRIVRL